MTQKTADATAAIDTSDDNSRQELLAANPLARYDHLPESHRPGGELWKIACNPVIKIHDASEGAAAPTWRAHKEAADEIAQALGTSDVFAVIQRGRGKKWWCTEWTVDGFGKDKNAARRRAALASSKEAAIREMTQHPSYHSSHLFKPEEGVFGWYKRL